LTHQRGDHLMAGVPLLRLRFQAVAVRTDGEHHPEHDGDHDAQYGDEPDHRFGPVTPAAKRIPVEAEPSGEPGEWILRHLTPHRVITAASRAYAYFAA